MTRTFQVLVLASLTALTTLACDDNPSGPGTTTTTNFSSSLLPSNEVPPVTGTEATGVGTVTIALHVTRDNSNNITNATSDFNVSLTGFPAGTAITAAHIHTGATGLEGGFVVNLDLAPGEVVLANGTGTIPKTGKATSADVAQGMINNPAGFYFNVHSANNPAGVVRGQLVKQ
jgi:hypothetical protein